MVKEVKPGGNVEDATAKYALDKIGQQVHDETVIKDAEQYRSLLKGTLSKAKFENAPKDKQTENDPCLLEYEYHTNATNGKNYPCRTGREKRFSDVGGGECDEKKIRGNNAGACAPYRRLNLCVKNLENINRYDKINNDTLLADVCLAAKHEGESLKGYHDQYQAKYPDTNSQLCTVLARSFADLGDIIRGKDLFLGNNRKDKLEDNLKRIFKEIYDKLGNPNAKEYYNKDNNGTGNYYKLREHWWEANRQQVWKAMTCNAGGGNIYFRRTCSGEQRTATRGNCQCIDTSVPTYFDYVPQFLRWFEEWAEDFCTKRKHKLQNAINICRGMGDDGNKLYCDLNGFDCKRTAKGEERFVEGGGCKKCSVPCDHFVHWIDNQKEEFDKQKNKYEKEIEKAEKITKASNEKINNIYEKEFYTHLKKDYNDVKSFLEKLSKEKICEKHPQVGDGKRTFIDFKNDKPEDIFSHTEYCQACPWCGMNCTNDGICTKRPDSTCQKKIPKKDYSPENTTDIPKLTPDKEKIDILQKYSKFCTSVNSAANGGGQIKEWECYYDKNNTDSEQNNNCILGKWKDFKKEQKVTSYNAFFYRSIIDMLNDSIDWRDKLKKCIENDNKQCVNKCYGKCKCYERWVQGKKEEWDKIKEHFGKQGDIKNPEDRDTTLKALLDVEFLDDIKDVYTDKQHLQKIEERLKDKMEENFNPSRKKTAIDEFLEEELKEAKDCLNTHKKDKCDTTDSYPGRIAPPQRFPHEDSDDSEDDEPPPKKTKPTKQVKNPCSSDGGTKEHPVLAEKVAHQMQQKAHDKMLANSVKNGEIGKGKSGESKSSLIGDICKATFMSSRKPSELTDACSITQDHSNAAKKESKNPCNGKGEKRFNVGEEWQSGHTIGTAQEVFLPPRREHMCTSNLEKLNVSKVTNNDNGNDTFLVEVLHAAKSEADDIKKKYKEINDKNGLKDDHATVCRAIHYSFADIGDIIKGTDLWDGNNDAKELQNNLVQIFKKIKEEIEEKHHGVKEKYSKDNESIKPPYKQLREDWWEANRRHVWQALACEAKDQIPCTGSPYEDYIPQRLRWMTEWVEWFCKAQKKQYTDLKTKCQKCKEKDKGCTKDSGDGECTKCASQCKEYEKKIKKWADQWQPMNIQYITLYGQAKTASASTGFPGAGADYHQVVDFLRELQEEYKTATSESDATKSPYATAAGYVHQELGTTVGCQEQNVFCSTGGADKEKYAFKERPHDHETACKCDTNVRPPAPPPRPATEEERPNDNRGRSERNDDGLRPAGPQHPPAEAPKEDICNIVDTILTGGKLDDACQQKYGEKSRVGWKCIPSGVKSDKNGSICIPPRRRKMYISPLIKWANGSNKGGGDSSVSGSTGQTKEGTEASGSGSGSKGEVKGPNGDAGSTGQGKEASQEQTTDTQTQSGSENPLLKAFVESAAVETFFLWDRYKKIKETVKKEREEAETNLVAGATTDEEQEQLEKGEIPDDFKRQMFYTLGDYRDICIGDENIINTLKVGGIDIKEISEKIHQFLKNDDKKPGQTTKPEDWWDKNAKHIWKGMICSLTYKENGSGKDVTITRHTDVYEKFFGKENTDKPNNIPTLALPGGTLGGLGSGTYESTYKYDDVSYGGNTGAIATGAGKEAGQKALDTDPTTLKDFVKRPFFFRWLEEWGEEFCRKQKHKLYIIKKECRDNKVCSGDGLNCTDPVPDNNKIYESFHCSTCARHCRWYKKWIERKKTEYEKQKDRYQTERESAKSDNGFSKTLEEDAAKFLERLKDGACKIENGNEIGMVKTGNSHINFGDETETFGHKKYCGTCPEFKFKCINGVCNGAKERKCNGRRPIEAKKIENIKNNTKDVYMVVSDNSKTEVADGLQACEKAGVFEGIRKDVWKCGEYCGVDICTLEKTNTNAEGKEHIIMKEFLKRWLETFFEDYSKIKHKISHCTKSENKSTCISGCEQKCKCVEQWTTKKKEEWDDIKKKYIQVYTENNGDDGNTLSFFLEGVPFDIEILKAIGPCGDLEAFEKSIHCNGTERSKSGKDGTKYDGILCLLDKLEEKAKNCQDAHKPSASPGKQCKDSAPTQTPPEEPLEEEEDPENKVGKPAICGDVEDKKETVEEDEKCDEEKDKEQKEEDSKEEKNDAPPEAPPLSPESSSSGEGNPEQTPILKPEEEAPAPQPPKDDSKSKSKEDTKPSLPKPPIQLLDDPLVIPSLATSTLSWSVGIAFFALTYWWLKKKTKRPVDLFSIMEIPQNNYGIPTTKSSNRYIPYGSGKYRGKRYIYIEGDSGTDSGYIDHYSDITSSSESEYEEFDINDIYAPGSPKYKTLIEVVLEPSKRDTQSDDTPSNKFTEKEWNELKQNFISQYLPNIQPNDVPNDYTSGTTPTNTNNTTMSSHNVDNNTHPTPPRHTLDQKPFIMSIHDRNLLSGEEYSYDMSNTNSGNNDLYSDSGLIGDNRDSYSGIDLINDTLSGGNHDIYDEILKRKENELFGTNHVKHTSTHSVAKHTNSDDPIHNQLNLFHKWLDRDRDMCKKWENKVELLDKLKEKWENERHSGIPSDDNIPSGTPSDNNKYSDIPSSNKTLNTDVSIQIDMDNNQVDDNIYLDTYPDKYTVDNINPVDENPTIPNLVGNINPNPTQVQIEMSVKNTQMMEEKSPIGDVWDI
ncbi:erythrocyte membrane protein 1, EMP1 [Plasmodium reichenowi]|uniref:Erythrocyte membrane protein 1, EMP1 n=1 Tax=Plasmodium reichenowi TaxID=5854 RepID=A0A060RQP5_PLARE|nr:erythrocyte membrane protein 1, EMP1 [Plasmodium reichenowi]